MTALRPRAPRRASLAAVIAPLAVLALASPALVACSSDDASDRSRGPSNSSTSVEEAPGGGSAPEEQATEAPPSPQDSDGATREQEAAPDSGTEEAPTTPDAPEPAIIATGTVDLVADDVAEARRDVQRVAAQAQGQVAREETTTDRDGVVDGSVLELRVPSETFTDTLAAIEEIAAISSSTRSLDDVSTEIVDVEARVRAQQASLTRVEALLGEAEDLSEVVAIEAELTRRQADLDSLSSQLAYLQDATTFSTITVFLERSDDEDRDDVASEEDEGFLDGLRTGWDGLSGAALSLAAIAGILLPWLGLGLLVFVPLVWLARRTLRRRAADEHAAAPGERADANPLPPHPGADEVPTDTP